MEETVKFTFPSWEEALIYLIVIAICIGLMFLFLKINKAVFAHLRKRNGKKIHYAFFEKLIKAGIIIYSVISILTVFFDIKNIWNTVLGGTALISGIVAFAAKDVIGDILAGLMISIYKPFSLGDRVKLQDGTVGLVSDITMRHTELIGVENMKVVVPNSIMNTMYITNFSKGEKYQSAYFEFSIGYDTDVDMAIKVLEDTIQGYEKSVPGRLNKDGEYVWGEGYFRRFEDSALIVGACVYYERGSVSSEKLISDVNLLVNEAFKKAGIEIPYQYVNVVEKE